MLCVASFAKQLILLSAFDQPLCILVASRKETNKGHQSITEMRGDLAGMGKICYISPSIKQRENLICRGPFKDQRTSSGKKQAHAKHLNKHCVRLRHGENKESKLLSQFSPVQRGFMSMGNRCLHRQKECGEKNQEKNHCINRRTVILVFSLALKKSLKRLEENYTFSRSSEHPRGLTWSEEVKRIILTELRARQVPSGTCPSDNRIYLSLVHTQKPLVW